MERIVTDFSLDVRKKTMGGMSDWTQLKISVVIRGVLRQRDISVKVGHLSAENF